MSEAPLVASHFATPHETLREGRNNRPQAAYAGGQDWGAWTFVWGTWAGMIVVTLIFAARYGISVPVADTWSQTVPRLIGEEPVTIAWLWDQAGDHRFPMGKLVHLGICQCTGGDFRAPVFVNVLGLAAMAFSMIWASTRVRGWTSYSDAFFPLAILHWGHFEHLANGWMVLFVIPSVLVSVLFIVVVSQRAPPTARTAILIGICLSALPLNGSSGIPFVAALALWLGWAGVLQWRSRGPHGIRNGLLTAGMAVMALLLLGLYFLHFQRDYSYGIPPSHTLSGVLRGSIHFLSWGFGANVYRPYLFGGGIVVLLFLSTAILALAWCRLPGERFRILGLFLFITGVVGLSLGLGWGRGERGEDMFQSRYIVFSFSALQAIYFIWGMYATAVIAQFVQMCLLILACMMLPFNMVEGLKVGKLWLSQSRAFERDMEAGAAPSILVDRYGSFLIWTGSGEKPVRKETKENLSGWLQGLRNKGIGKFRFLREDPAVQEVSVQTPRIALHEATWNDGIVTGTGNWGVMASAGVFLPTVAVVAVFALGRQIRVLLFTQRTKMTPKVCS
jgi:hypothetical protein